MESYKRVVDVIQDTEILISKMDSEIELLRNIVYRYAMLRGENIMGGELKVPDSISFGIRNSDSTKCVIVDNDVLKVESNYQSIKKLIEKIKR